jgi:hypothetical protein
MTNFTATPDWSALPAPVDEGAAKHLVGIRLPSIPFPATDGRRIDLNAQRGRVVIYAYPRTGVRCLVPVTQFGSAAELV